MSAKVRAFLFNFLCFGALFILIRLGILCFFPSNKAYQVVDYLKEGISKEQIKELLTKLQLSPIELVRTKENVWKEHFKGKTLTDEQIIEAMVQYPQLIERPIVVVGDKAIIGRPTEKINDII